MQSYINAKDILREFVLNKKISSEKPVGHILGGQSAAGKTRLIQHITSKYQKQELLIINGDILRAFHPNAYEWQIRNDPNYAERTQEYANTLASWLLHEAIGRKCNILIEGTMRKFDVPSDTAKAMGLAGYGVYGHVMAVAFPRSLVNAFLRYEIMFANTGFGRKTPLDIHRAGYDALPEVVDALWREGDFLDFFVYTHNATVLDIKNTISETIDTVRNQDFTETEVNILRRDINLVLEYMNKRGAKLKEIHDFIHLINESGYGFSQ